MRWHLDPDVFEANLFKASTNLIGSPHVLVPVGEAVVSVELRPFPMKIGRKIDIRVRNRQYSTNNLIDYAAKFSVNELSQWIANLRECDRRPQRCIGFHPSEQSSNRLLHCQVFRERMRHSGLPLVVVNNKVPARRHFALENSDAFFR